MTIISGINIQSTLSITDTGMDLTRNRWEVGYKIVKETIEPNVPIETINRTLILRDAPEVLGENDEVVTPAITDLADFKALFSDYDSLISVSTAKAIEHAQTVGIFVEYNDPTDEAWENEETPEPENVPAWAAGEFVAIGMKRSFNGEVYRVVQSHTTQSDWQPDITPALWKLMPQSTAGSYPAWVQPIGSTDAYQVNDKVNHNGLNWNNTTPNNVWEPGVFGWEQIA